MSKDKLKGFLMGLGAGVLVAAIIEFSGESAKDATTSIDAGNDPVSQPPVVMTARAADA